MSVSLTKIQCACTTCVDATYPMVQAALTALSAKLNRVGWVHAFNYADEIPTIEVPVQGGSYVFSVNEWHGGPFLAGFYAADGFAAGDDAVTMRPVDADEAVRLVS